MNYFLTLQQYSIYFLQNETFYTCIGFYLCFFCTASCRGKEEGNETTF